VTRLFLQKFFQNTKNIKLKNSNNKFYIYASITVNSNEGRNITNESVYPMS